MSFNIEYQGALQKYHSEMQHICAKEHIKIKQNHANSGKKTTARIMPQDNVWVESDFAFQVQWKVLVNHIL